MKIGIISDIHENFHNLILALKKMKEEKVEQIICLGDLMNDGIAKVLSISATPVFMVWGNNDGDRVVLTKTSSRAGSNLVSSINTYDFLEYDNRKIFVTHFQDLAIPMARSGMFDAIFCGHTHISQIEQVGKCLIANPGEVSAQRTGTGSLAIYDTTLHEVRLVVLENTVTLKTKMVEEFFEANREKLGFRPGVKL